MTRQYDRLMRLTNMFSDNTMLDGGESLVCDYDLAGRRTRIADATGTGDATLCWIANLRFEIAEAAHR